VRGQPQKGHSHCFLNAASDIELFGLKEVTVILGDKLGSDRD